jgi:lipase ATG15
MPTSTPTSPVPSSTSSHSCTSPAWFGLICLDPSPTATPTPTKAPEKVHCVRRSWLGFCKEWSSTNNVYKEEI